MHRSVDFSQPMNDRNTGLQSTIMIYEQEKNPFNAFIPQQNLAIMSILEILK